MASPKEASHSIEIAGRNNKPLRRCTLPLTSGCNPWNGGEIYGTPDNNSLTLLKNYYTLYPEDADRVVLNIKGATRLGLQPDGSPDYTLGERGRIDLFECARRDPKVPLKETLGALAELVDEGKIGGVALCEVSANTIREAAKITRIVAVEVELSLWSTEPLTNGIAEACFELNIPIIASVTLPLEALLEPIAENPCSYSPIGRGMFTGQIKSLEDIPQGDVRKILPRFQPQNFGTNMKLVRELEKIAQNEKVHSGSIDVSLGSKPVKQ
ncbi:hypothetical protein HO133_004922 [Letharia lupina]|uniref:NADP-dependent oxidoreductase domain-containing protein n=1 Tax=Letharia lupina TaxID=560253 RepID=A0A8H6F8E8_9LECA|nr:uncharacterized protein HO133_004922 [Letharia lupina]KAF6219097.1 hypothetical protein HO133_004922 [Letharia lupina]